MFFGVSINAISQCVIFVIPLRIDMTDFLPRWASSFLLIAYSQPQSNLGSGKQNK